MLNTTMKHVNFDPTLGHLKEGGLNNLEGVTISFTVYQMIGVLLNKEVRILSGQ